ncbi:chitobiase/beta-hexosaminidase C-terminal domain-containing protein [Brevibacillus sp. TJ4]|uniref:chitobiase/beta-hexosaminidase C-terminal domain-containing protein n=2 Tax=Brevibacillus TaxID=55080 RepID=UPI003BA1D09A
MLTILFAWLGTDTKEATASESDYEYQEIAGGVEITKYVGTAKDITIPDTLGGKGVIRIGNTAFRNKDLTSVTIPDSVTTVGESAFASNQLESVTIPDSVTSIGRWAFQNNRLKSVQIGNGVTNIETSAFASNQLESVTIPDNVTNVGHYAFKSNQLESVTIPDSVTNIGDGAFDDNQLESVTIPDSVTSLGEGAFRNNRLQSVQIGNGVTNIETSAFASNQLESVTIPDSVTSIGGWAFRNNRLQSVQIGNGMTIIGNGAFENNQLESVTIPDSVTSIGGWAFRNNRLQSVQIGNGVTNIGTYAFAINPLKVIIGEIESQAQDYAQNNDILFLNFDPWSSGGQEQKEAATTVKALWSKTFSLQYQWTTTEETPALPTEPEGDGWTAFESGDTLNHSLDDAQTTDSTWYVHIYAEDEDGKELFTVHSGAFLLEVPEQVARPVADPSGGVVPSGTKVTLSTPTEGATIYYTTDGSEPTSSSAEYTAPIEVTTEMTIKAIAAKDGMLDSEVMEEHYTILSPEQVAKPVADPSGGAVPSGTRVTLSTATEGATIYYTTDGSTPSRSSMEYTAPIEVASEMTIKAIAIKSGMLDSQVMTESYTILSPEQVAKPVADPSGGVVPSGTKVTLSTPTEGATIYYTTDGSEPTSSSAEYTAPIEVTTEMTIKAIAAKDGMLDSEVMEEHYTILSPEQVAKPVADPSGGAVPSGTRVTLSTATEGATIYYTTDGSTPSRSSMEYTAPIEVASEMTIKAIAIKSGMLDSQVMTESYTILSPEQVAKPVADPSGGAVPSGTRVTLSTATEGATIYYTTDGSTPSRSSMEYTAPIEVASEMTIKAIAMKSGMLDSQVMTESYTILSPEQVAKPVADPSGGAVPSGTRVTLSTATEGATIYYTTDGSTPSRSSMEYTAPIEVASEMTIKAIAIKSGMLDSQVMTESYTILSPEQVARPVADPSGGVVPSGTKVTLSTPTEGATVYYTTDGSEPTSSSAEYTAPIEVTTEMTIKAIAMKSGMLDSELMEEQYTIETIPAPANLTASAANRSVTLEWDAVTETGSVTYAVYQAEGASAPVDPANWRLVQSNIAMNSYIVTGLTNGKTYAFAVKAVSAEGTSDFSNVATATPRASGGNSGSGGGGGGRGLSNNADLADLQVWAGGKPLNLSPSFASGTTAYTARTTSEQVELVVKEAHSAAKVILQDKVMADRAKVDLEEGKNTFVLTVRAENDAEKNYTLTIYRETPQPSEPAIEFSDIAGHWAKNYILRAVEKGFVSGYPDGTFKPNNPVTRAEFTVMLAGALKLKSEGTALTFADNEQIGEWAKQAVAQAVEARIIDGYDDGSFRPNNRITRAEMAAMIARSLTLQTNPGMSTGFADDEVIPQWAKGAVEAIRKLGIVDGRGGNRFVANEIATRAEATVMLLRMLEVNK